MTPRGALSLAATVVAALAIAIAAHAAPPGVAVPRAATLRAAADGTVAFPLRCADRRVRCEGVAEVVLDGAAAGGGAFSIAPGERAVVPLVLAKGLRARLAAEGALAGEITTADASGERTRRANVVVQASAIPAEVPASSAVGRWAPTAYDTCSAELHESFAVVGPDGRRYPTWHPPVVLDPVTGSACTFGHEHGADPRGSDIHRWVVKHFTRKGYAAFAGIPFGLVNQALDDWAGEPGNEGTPTRAEDNVGHKIDWANDVQLLAADGRTPLGVECDFLFKLHQGSHSSDATRNNVHELIYAAKCSDGTKIIASTLSAFGAPNEFHSSCAPGGVVPSSGAPAYPTGEGSRSIPDRRCVDTYVLVPPSQGSSLWAVYESWRSSNVLRAADGSALAFFDPDFAVFNPSRFADITPAAPQGVGRMVELAWLEEGERANRWPWTEVWNVEPFPYADPRSPFDGAQREFSLGQTRVANGNGPRWWFTDAYGGRGATVPFPGSVRQLVGSVDNSHLPALERQLFGRGVDHGGHGSGVHAPN